MGASYDGWPMWGTPKRRSVAFVDNNRPNSGARQKHSERRYSVITNVKLPEMDELLEETLVNNTNTVKPLTRREAQILQIDCFGQNQQGDSPNTLPNKANGRIPPQPAQSGIFCGCGLAAGLPENLYAWPCTLRQSPGQNACLFPL